MKSRYWLLVIAVVAGLAIRVSHLSTIGYGLHPDEVLYGIEGTSIAATGCDIRHTGCPPLYLKGYSTQWDNRTSVLYPYIYAALWRVVPFSNFWLRFPSVLAGLGVIVLIYGIARQLFPKQPHAAGWAAIFVALSPIGISWSRIGHDPITMPLFAAGIVYALLRSRSSPRWLLLAAALLAIGLFSYQPFKLVGLGVTVATWLAFPPRWSSSYRRWLGVALVVGSCLATPFLYNQIHNWSVVQKQFTMIAVWHHAHTLRLIVVNSINLVLYWFFNPSLGLIFVSPFVIIGLVHIRKQKILTAWFIVWVLIAIAPAAVTVWAVGSNEMQSRALGLLGPIELLAGVGVAAILERGRQRLSLERAGSVVMWSIVSLAILYSAVIAGMDNQQWPSWRNLTLSGIDQPLQQLNRPAYAMRPVVVNLFFFTQPLDLAWREQTLTSSQQPLSEWREFSWGPEQRARAQYPAVVGRFTFCRTADCWQAHDGKLYMLPIEEQPQLKPLSTFTFRLYDYVARWKIVDNQ